MILFLLRKYLKGDWKRSYYNIGPLTVLLLGSIFRCVLPLDFPGFTLPISSTSVYAAVNTALYTPFILTGPNGEGITPLMVFFVIWFAGTAGLLGRFLWKHFQWIHSLVHLYQEVTEGPVYDMALKCSRQLSVKKFRLVTDESILGPHVGGFLYPRVMLPDRDYTDTQLYYILSHEFGHWKNGDMVLRLLTNLICYLFWWNPFVYLLRYRLEDILELNCDGSLLAVGNFSDDDRIEYLNAILSVVRSNQERKRQSGLFVVTSDFFSHNVSREAFQERLNLIGEFVPNKKKNRWALVFSIIAMAFMLVLSYRYILQPYYYVPEQEYVEEGGDQVTTENVYLVEEADGSYSVYVNGEFFKTTPPEGAQIFLDGGVEVRSREQSNS